MSMEMIELGARRTARTMVWLVWMAAAVWLRAQEAGSNDPAAQPARATAPERSLAREIVIASQDFTLEEGEQANQVVVLNGLATIRGTVRETLVVIDGRLKMDGVVKGDVVLIGSRGTVGAAGRVDQNVVLVASDLKVQRGAKIAHKPVDLWPKQGLPTFHRFIEWVTDGLLRLRPLPPRHGWAWKLVLMNLALLVAINGLLPRSVSACQESLRLRPLGSFFGGLLVLTLGSLVLLLLVVSVVGLSIAPFLITAILAGVVFGKAALYRTAGEGIAKWVGWAWLGRPSAALVAGALLCCGAYTVPVVGGVLWLALTPLGIGAALLAASESLRREKVAAVVSQTLAAPVPVAGVVPPPPLPSLSALDLMALPRAGFWRRFLALLLDFILLLFVCGLQKHPSVPVMALVWWGYQVGMCYWRGGTIGGIILNLRLIRVDGRPLTWPVLLVRSVSSVFSGLFLFLGFFWAGWTRERQTWHDQIAGTVFVRLPKNVPLF